MAEYFGFTVLRTTMPFSWGLGNTAFGILMERLLKPLTLQKTCSAVAWQPLQTEMCFLLGGPFSSMAQLVARELPLMQNSREQNLRMKSISPLAFWEGGLKWHTAGGILLVLSLLMAKFVSCRDGMSMELTTGW
jgi:hypothetical protein